MLDLSGVATKNLVRELARRIFRGFHTETHVNVYLAVATQYGVDITDEYLVRRFFLEEVPSLPQEDQDLIELQLKL